MGRRSWGMFVMLGFALLPVHLTAQAGTSTIIGVVRDSTGGATPGVTVRIVNDIAGVAVETVSDELGSYRADALVAGQVHVYLHSR